MSTIAIVVVSLIIVSLSFITIDSFLSIASRIARAKRDQKDRAIIDGFNDMVDRMAKNVECQPRGMAVGIKVEGGKLKAKKAVSKAK